MEARSRYYWNDDEVVAPRAGKRFWSSLNWMSCEANEEDEDETDEYENVDLDEAQRRAKEKRNIQPMTVENEVRVVMPVGCSANIGVPAEVNEANRAYLVRHGARADNTETMMGVAG